MKKNIQQDIDTKIFSDFNSFSGLLKKWKGQNQKIVFTNGCFDIVHRGHVDSLVQSAAFGDKLIVGLNSDASVKILKGENRPIIDQESRAIVLAAFRFVDAVVLFEEETPYELIEKIIPDVLVKGKEYQLEEIAGHDVVLANGGTIERIDLTPGFSSTEIIRKMKTEE